MMDIAKHALQTLSSQYPHLERDPTLGVELQPL